MSDIIKGLDEFRRRMDLGIVAATPEIVCIKARVVETLVAEIERLRAIIEKARTLDPQLIEGIEQRAGEQR